MIVVGIDPGTGSSSACGLAVFDSETRDILLAKAIWPSSPRYFKPTHHRIKNIVSQLETQLKSYAGPDTLIAIESFVMRGKGGETLQRMIGATLTALPYECQVVEVQNTTMKLWVGKSGKASKAEVGQGVSDFFDCNEPSSLTIDGFVNALEFDVIDALGIAVAALKMHETNGRWKKAGR